MLYPKTVEKMNSHAVDAHSPAAIIAQSIEGSTESSQAMQDALVRNLMIMHAATAITMCVQLDIPLSEIELLIEQAKKNMADESSAQAGEDASATPALDAALDELLGRED